MCQQVMRHWCASWPTWCSRSHCCQPPCWWMDNISILMHPGFLSVQDLMQLLDDFKQSQGQGEQQEAVQGALMAVSGSGSQVWGWGWGWGGHGGNNHGGSQRCYRCNELGHVASSAQLQPQWTPMRRLKWKTKLWWSLNSPCTHFRILDGSLVFYVGFPYVFIWFSFILCLLYSLFDVKFRSA